MTYCVAMSLDAGMIFASDSRTNAGVDQVGKFSKMRVFSREGDRVIVTLSSGNLSITQNALNIMEQRARSGDAQLNLWNALSMFDVARLVGDALREVKTRDGPYLLQNNIDSNANFIVGGQLRGEPPRLFEIYSEGNFIEATPDTCYFQIGESKYGKPVIDRVIPALDGPARSDQMHHRVVRLDDALEHIGRAPDRPGCLRDRQPQAQDAKANRGVGPVFPDGPQPMGGRPARGLCAAAQPRVDLAACRTFFFGNLDYTELH